MIDLGKYEGTVLAAYGITLLLLVLLIGMSLWASAKARRALEALEKNG